jgi:pimeloyl-ACP methyl ester carboxylesterase
VTAAPTLAGPRPEQTRACYPDAEGFLERGGVRIHYEVYGSGDPTVLLLPTWSVIHSRCWKMQIPYLARHCRVVTFDGRGNGRSDRPAEPAAYAEAEFAADALAVLDVTATDRAFVAGFSMGAQRALLLAAGHPERVQGLVFVGSSVPLSKPTLRAQAVARFTEQLDEYEGWQKFNRHYWLTNYRDFLEFFFSQVFTEPHSTKQIEDCVGWGLETTPETLIATVGAPGLDEAAARCWSCTEATTRSGPSPPAPRSPS